MFSAGLKEINKRFEDNSKILNVKQNEKYFQILKLGSKGSIWKEPQSKWGRVCSAEKGGERQSLNLSRCQVTCKQQRADIESANDDLDVGNLVDKKELWKITIVYLRFSLEETYLTVEVNMGSGKTIYNMWL